MADATPEFKQQLQQAFEMLHDGQIFTYRRTFTSGDVALFCGVTGDYNPYHMDYTFLAESWYKRPIIPGLLTASMITHIGGLLGFLATQMQFDFLRAVYVGDTITCTITFGEKDAARRQIKAQATYVNQDQEVVLRATFAGFPAQVRLAR